MAVLSCPRHLMRIFSLFLMASLTGAFTLKPAFHSSLSVSSPSSSSARVFSLWAKKRQKESMAQKLARRSQKRQAQGNLVDTVPRCALDFQSTPASSTTTTATLEQAPQKAPATPAPEQTQAQKLLANQRDSVATLTAVKQALDRLDETSMVASLQQDGSWVVDDFLNTPSLDNPGADDSTSATASSSASSLLHLVEEMRAEAARLYKDANNTMDRVGEFQVPLVGGPQYATSPRSVEWVVAVTQHLTAKLQAAWQSSSTTTDDDSKEDTNGVLLSLNPKQCMAAMKTWDRKALLASLSLLTGDTVDEDQLLATQPNEDEQHAAAAVCIVTDPNDDLRRVSLRYYLDDWKGGDLTLDGRVVSVKRDRLVVWLSDKTKVREAPWVGWEEQPTASWIELHLLQA